MICGHFFFRQGDIPIYAENRVIEALKIRFNYIFKKENKYPGVLNFNINNITNKPFLVSKIKIIPIQVFHNKLPVLGFRINNFAYITDAKTIPDDEIKKINWTKCFSY